MTTHFDVDPTWAVGDKAHGGYLLRQAVEAALDDPHPHPLAVSAHYLSPPEVAPVEVSVTRVRTGRRVATSHVSLAQAGAARVEVLLSAGTLAAGEPHWRSDEGRPALPPLEDCPRSPAENPLGITVGYLDHIDLRLDPATAQWAAGKPSGHARVSGWVRRDDGADAGPLDLLVFADALPPVTFDLGIYSWAPTLELTVHLRALPASGWLRVTQRARWLQDGWLDEECEIWDGDGRLVCQARQLAGYRLE